MKLLSTATLLTFALVSCGPASAQVTHDLCNDYYDMSEATMGARQAGVSMRDVMDVAIENGVATSIVQDAYDVPRYSTEEYKQRAKVEFANRIYAECLRAMD